MMKGGWTNWTKEEGEKRLDAPPLPPPPPLTPSQLERRRRARPRPLGHCIRHCLNEQTNLFIRAEGQKGLAAGCLRQGRLLHVLNNLPAAPIVP